MYQRENRALSIICEGEDAMEKDMYEILVVDDEPHMCDVVSRILESEGYSVSVASDGRKALQLTKENEPDLIILDLMMPGINGREVCRIVRKLSPETRVMYFTAKVETDPQMLKELRNEADGFISKPASSKQILSNVNTLLSIP
jgi:CheY-like chemotaxis protein